MSTRKRVLLYAGVACAVLVLAPATAAAAGTGRPATRAATDTPAGYVTVSTSGISMANNTEPDGKATCPKGTVVLSGGAYIASSSVMTGINSSFPSSDRAWFVAASNFSGATTTFNVYAVCAKRPKGYKQLTSDVVINPAGQQDSATEECPTADKVLGGGVDSDRSVTIGMTSSYPGTSASWAAAVSNFSAAGSEFEVVAVCASKFPHYAIAHTSASDPAGVQKGIVQDCTSPAVVLGGGNKSSNTTNLRIEIKTTQPFPASGAGWKSGENNDTSAGNTLTSYAICAT